MRALIVLLILVSTSVFAAPIYQASNDKVKVILYDEPCQLSAVVNLPLRATWTERGVTFEGCYGGGGGDGLLAAYFEDRTVMIFSVHAFRSIEGI